MPVTCFRKPVPPQPRDTEEGEGGGYDGARRGAPPSYLPQSTQHHVSPRMVLAVGAEEEKERKGKRTPPPS